MSQQREHNRRAELRSYGTLGRKLGGGHRTLSPLTMSGDHSSPCPGAARVTGAAPTQHSPDAPPAAPASPHPLGDKTQVSDSCLLDLAEQLDNASIRELLIRLDEDRLPVRQLVPVLQHVDELLPRDAPVVEV